MKTNIKAFPYHPFLLSVFPAITLYMSNKHVLEISMIWATLAVMAATAALLLLAGKLLFKDVSKGAILASVAILIITNYGNYQDNLYDVKIPFFFKPVRMDHNFYLWSSLVLIILAWFLLRRAKKVIKPTKIFNAFAVILFATSFFAGGSNITEAKSNVTYSDDKVLDMNEPDQLPDIYFLVMDAYGRADVLQELFEFDNSDFTDYLRKKGFYVADSSTSNYGQTILSIPSALNMQYADDIARQAGVESEDRKPLRKWLLDNKTVASLRSIGYKAISTDASVFDLVTFDEGVDIFYSTPGTDLNLFENHYLNTTILRAFNNRKSVTILDPFGMHRKKILNAFKYIKNVPNKKNGPYFVYGHVLSPHQPFVFDKNGESVDPDYEYGIWKPRETGFPLDKYKEGYVNQLQFVNSKLKETIDYILEKSKIPPIIILQGDHGPASQIMNVNGLENNNFKERMTILNAYNFPDKDYSRLYDTISPVNSFKIVFNQFFGTDIELIEDKAMYSSWYQPYKFFDVTDEIRKSAIK